MGTGGAAPEADKRMMARIMSVKDIALAELISDEHPLEGNFFKLYVTQVYLCIPPSK